MVANLSFNPATTGNIIGSFQPASRGFIQGTLMDDPVAINLLHGGPLASTETIPMWGGVAISTSIPVVGSEQLGPLVTRALTNAAITGFSVFNQMGNAIVLPNGGIPLAYSGQKISYLNFGSNARIPLQIDPALVNQDGSITTTQFSWDFTEQRLTLYSPAYAQQTPSAYTSYTSATGLLVLAFTTATGLVVGEYATLAGFTGANAALNGTWIVTASSGGGTSVTFQAPAGLGTLTLSAGYLVAGGGAVGIRQVEAILSTGCKTVTYNSSTGAVSWNESGAVAVCLI
jgi:hypothetical protein